MGIDTFNPDKFRIEKRFGSWAIYCPFCDVTGSGWYDLTGWTWDEALQRVLNGLAFQHAGQRIETIHYPAQTFRGHDYPASTIRRIVEA